MPKYIVNLHAQVAYEYEVEANTPEEAIEAAKRTNEDQTSDEQTNHEYYFGWANYDVYPIKDESPEYKSNPLFGESK